MTLVGLGWALTWGVAGFYMLRWMWRTRKPSVGTGGTRTASPARGALDRPGPAPSSGPVPATPRGRSTEEYAADGIRQLQIMLIQSARRDRPLPDESGQN